jgi:ribosomal protein L7Ae-like RNA K-turn-binding protein
VLLAGDASETQTQKLRGLLEARGVPHAEVATRADLGDALGASPTTAAALTDASFAEGLRKRLDAAGMPVR